ncbi:hypothetical protein TESG_02082 [Trichophyton tonsurans CBS 112818]|uniref:Uncharacterized protein n=1 Tax=Trichophyton tonsurans (strain CBS 112818) TaxID=647933 RepID=F2RTC1_TRIT1|nr:hypothetical protein TESG_02082 [Trichophyton tonsurans CBS 112818]
MLSLDNIAGLIKEPTLTPLTPSISNYLSVTDHLRRSPDKYAHWKNKVTDRKNLVNEGSRDTTAVQVSQDNGQSNDGLRTTVQAWTSTTVQLMDYTEVQEMDLEETRNKD